MNQSLFIEWTDDFELFKQLISIAIENYGYFYIKIPIEYWNAIKELERLLQEFSKLPLEEKNLLNVHSGNGSVYLGYVAEQSENTPKATNSPYHEPGINFEPDLVQKLSFQENFIDQLKDFGIKQKDLDKIQPIIDQIKKYIEFQNKIKFQIFKALIEIYRVFLSTDIDFSSLDEYLAPTFIRCLLYPKVDGKVISMGSHTDIGLFTIILDLGKEICLEAKINNEFISIPNYEMYALVITGEFFNYICQKIKPLVHRVRTPTKQERISIVNFVTLTELLKVRMTNGPYDCIREEFEKENKFEITYGEFMQKFSSRFR